jgi:hypothetical protein
MAKTQIPQQYLQTTEQEDEQNRQLLYEAVYNQFLASGASPKEAATSTEELILKHINNLFGFQGLAHSIGALSIPYFCKYFLQDTFIPKKTNAARELALLHLEIWEELDKMFLQDEYDKIEVAWPRGCAKTTVLDFALTVWLHCYEKSKYTLVAGKTESDSTEFIAQARQAFEENQYLIAGFGKLIKPNDYTVNKLELELTNKTKIQAISSTSSMRGKKYGGSRPSTIIADDFQGRADVITQESRDKKYNTWVEDSGYAGDKAVFRDGVKIKPATKFIVLGTILHRNCYMSRLLLNKDYKHILKRVVDFEVDEYFHEGLWEEFSKIYFDDKLKDSVATAKEFYYQNEEAMTYETIWDDKYDCLDLAIDYFNNPIAFKQEMMNDASRIGEKWFKSMCTQPAEEIEAHTFEKTMLVADPASSVSVRSDYTALCVGSIADNNFAYIRKGIIAKLGFDDFCAKVVELLKVYPDTTHVSVEKNLYSGADVLKIKELILKDSELKNRTIEFINKMQRVNKDEKISTIIQGVNMGQIIFNEEDYQANEQIMNFCGQLFSEHDDFPDCVAQMMNDIKEIEVVYRVEFMNRNKLFGR